MTKLMPLASQTIIQINTFDKSINLYFIKWASKR